jgi:class 3 adenylate cyclase
VSHRPYVFTLPRRLRVYESSDETVARRIAKDHPMPDYATIFIPDISGYTEFLSKTELDHSSHIINELLELLAESNNTDCTLSEVEGDALLFYRKGKPIAFDEMTQQCLGMFQNFHSKLKLVERDTITRFANAAPANRLRT